MKYLITMWLLVCSLMLAGCAQKLPDYEAGYGMVAVPYHFVNRTQYSFLYRFEWKCSEDDRFSVVIEKSQFSNDVSVSGLIPAGQYLVDSIVVSVVNDAQVISQWSRQEHKIKDPFVIDVHEGSITLIPFVYEMEQYVESESIFVKKNFHWFQGDEQSTYYNKLKNREGIDQWKIVTLK